MSWTPGPWIVDRWSDQHDCRCVRGDGNVIAGAFYLGGTSTANANAQLIAAAPRMYERIAKLAADGDAEALAILEVIRGHA